MTVEIDHLALACASLDDGIAHVEAALGVPLQRGGQHPAFGTHNALLSLGPDEYFEVIAIDPDAPPPGRARWFDLDRFTGPPRLSNWIVRVPDLATAAAPGRILDLERGAYRWQMAVPDDGILPNDNLHPAMMSWKGPHPAPALPDRGVRLAELVLTTPDPDALRSLPGADDPRVRIAPGDPVLNARFTTPGGDAWL